MFEFLKHDPVKTKQRKLQKEYERAQERARDLQRSGDIEGFAARTAEATRIYEEIEEYSRASGRPEDRGT